MRINFTWCLAATIALASCDSSTTTEPTESPKEVVSEGARPHQSKPLPTLLAEAKRNAVDSNNRDAGRDGYRYTVDSSTIHRGDFDGDGDQDAVLFVNTCEAKNCHATTQGSFVVLARQNGTGFSKLFSFEAGLSPKLDSIKPGAVTVTGMMFGPDDPGCCATEKHVFKVRIDGATTSLIEREIADPNPSPDLASDDNQPTDKAHCTPTDYGCLYDTQWVPTQPNARLAGLSEEDFAGGAGCAATDSANRTVFGFDGISAVIRSGQTLVQLKATDDSQRRFSGDGWQLLAQEKREVAKVEEGEESEAYLHITPPEGEPFKVQVRLWCGA